jgi:hypothetical protein
MRQWLKDLYAGNISVGRNPKREVPPIAHLTELDDYTGKWVAVRDGHVITSADSSVDLAKKLRSSGELRGAVMQFVQPEAHAFIVGVG